LISQALSHYRTAPAVSHALSNDPLGGPTRFIHALAPQRLIYDRCSLDEVKRNQIGLMHNWKKPSQPIDKQCGIWKKVLRPHSLFLKLDGAYVPND
jgi:hypothetical protein